MFANMCFCVDWVGGAGGEMMTFVECHEGHDDSHKKMSSQRWATHAFRKKSVATTFSP